MRKNSGFSYISRDIYVYTSLRLSHCAIEVIPYMLRQWIQLQPNAEEVCRTDFDGHNRIVYSQIASGCWEMSGNIISCLEIFERINTIDLLSSTKYVDFPLLIFSRLYAAYIPLLVDFWVLHPHLKKVSV